ncbi:uncharacterized protein EDB91DRAFT_1168639 [Suillus paluster]|uniref:uncharacterized protein n=1 Tax=Suillus paluster TaxID=48578 RepID=UPI001B87A3B3|nr:uncharacterized protein EDB91DRAFT_1168639 [Suillus paluster]KAG1725435.1 hypothetical protein EDB91DRAFT_1168639 [Suillus paluster]
MSRYLVQNDGLFLGSSSACSLVACTLVTTLYVPLRNSWNDCDSPFSQVRLQ